MSLSAIDNNNATSTVYSKKSSSKKFLCILVFRNIIDKNDTVNYFILSYTIVYLEQSTIKLSKKIKNKLKNQMNYPGETYETVIARLLKIIHEDDMLSESVIKNIEEGVADIKAGRVYTSEQVKNKLELK